jgi:hypothetical protein
MFEHPADALPANRKRCSLKPGESTKIEVTFNSKGRRGIQQQRVTVTTNDPENEEMILTIKCNVLLT